MATLRVSPVSRNPQAVLKRRRRRGAIYSRYSSRFQHSTDDQIRDCRKWADENDVEVLDCHVYIDEGKTGKSHKRSAFQAMMKAVGNDEVDVVVIFATSRLFRKSYKCFAFVEENIVDPGKRCVFVKSRVDTDKKDEWRKLLQVNALVDELSVQLQIAHIQSAHEGLLRLGVVFGTLTYGFGGEVMEGRTTRLGKPSRRLIVDEVTATWVKKIFEWFTKDDLSIAEIVRRLTAQKAPLPQRGRVTRWTALIVRRMLSNTRYIGTWKYGNTEAIWQNKASYSRQIPRETPLAEIQLDHLRLIDHTTWLRAQQRLTDYKGRGGRKPRNPERDDQPKLLNRFCFCQKHDHLRMYVGGAKADKMFCRGCQEDPDRELFALLDRKLATQAFCGELSRLIHDDLTLVDGLIAACRRHAEDCQRPDPKALQDKKQEEVKLTRSIQFIMDASGDTEEDEAENQAKLRELRRQRSVVRAAIQQLEQAAAKPFVVPSRAKLEGLLKQMADVLMEASFSKDASVLAAARRVVELITGGRIVVSQQGERKPKRGWLRLTFKMNLIKPILEDLSISGGGQEREAFVDVRRLTFAQEIADETKALMDQGLLIKVVRQKICEKYQKVIGRVMIFKALKFWYTSRGLTVPDGRARRSTLKVKHVDPQLYEKVIDQLMNMYTENKLLGEIAQELDLDRNTVTAFIERWHGEHNLPMPDGRTRRKGLDHKSRPAKGGDAGATSAA